MAEIQPITETARDETILCYQHPDCVGYDVVRDGIVYRVVPGWPQYRVGDDGSGWGRRNCRVPGKYGWYFWRRLKPQKHSGGYFQFHFYDDYKRTPMFVHRLVLETFVGPCPPGKEACHANGRRTDNRLENLRWDTRVNNHSDKREHGTLLQGSGITNSKLKEEFIPIIRALGEVGVPHWQIAHAFHVNPTNVGFIIRGDTWKHVPESDG